MEHASFDDTAQEIRFLGAQEAQEEYAMPATMNERLILRLTRRFRCSDIERLALKMPFNTPEMASSRPLVLPSW